MTAVETPRMAAISMARYITDDSTIIAYIKHSFNYEMTPRELLSIKRDNLPSDRVLDRQKSAAPLSFANTDISVPPGDPLIMALERHHPAIVAQERRRAAVIGTGRLRRV